jgi:hypothetical protein
VARVRAGDVDVEDLPVAYTRGHGRPIGWRSDARCKDIEQPRAAASDGSRVTPWLATTGETYVFVGRRTAGAKLIEMALLECAMCRVQWDCASFGVSVGEPVGVWAMSIEDRRWLQRQSEPDLIIKQAEADGQPVQFAVRDLRAAAP